MFRSDLGTDVISAMAIVTCVLRQVMVKWSEWWKIIYEFRGPCIDKVVAIKAKMLVLMWQCIQPA